MAKILNSLQFYKNLILKYKIVILSFLGIFILSILNTFHAQYPDEFDNILGGYFITQGKLPYIAYFTHHGPFAYFYAAFIALFSGPSFVKFRVLLAIANFLFAAGYSYYIFKRFGQKYFYITLAIWSVIAMNATFWWAHMLLSDSLAASLLLGVFINLLFTYLKNEKLRLIDIALNSFLLSTALLTSLTYVYVIGILYLSILYWLFKFRKDLPLKSWLKAGGIVIAPYVIFLLYLAVTGSFSDYYYDSIYYNQKFYVRLSDGSELNNPIRHMIIIFVEFFDRYRVLLVSIKDLNLGNPLTIFLALSNVSLIVYLMVTRRFKLSLLLTLLLIYLTTRTNPVESVETDYQSLPYNYFSLLNGVMAIVLYTNYLKKQLEWPVKLVLSSIFLLMLLLSFFTALSITNRAIEKFYSKYMGTQPLIYDRPAIANNLNKVLTKDDYFYVGPFDFEEYLYIHSKPASKYTITIPGMDYSDKIKGEILNDFKTNRPKIVVFNTNDKIYGKDPGRFLMEYLNQEYFTLDSLNYPTEMFTINQNSFGTQQKYDLARHFFFDKNKKDEILEKLLAEGWITKK